MANNNHASELILEAQINYSVSLRSINKQIRQLNKDPELQKLNLKVELSQSFVNTMKKFVEATKTLGKAMENQNKVMKEVTTTTRNSEGALIKTTEQWLKSGEVITKVGKDYKDIVNSKKKANDASKQEIKTLEQLQAEYSNYTLARTKENFNKKGEVSSYTNTLKDKNTGNTVTVNTDAEGNVRNYSAVEDYMKQQKLLEAAKKQALDYEKQINAERERIHKETYNTNKAISDQEARIEAKKVADDKLHYQAMQQNAKIDSQYANTIKDNADRIAKARTQYASNAKLINELNTLEQSPIGSFSQRNNTAQRLNGEIQAFQKYAQDYTKLQNNIANAQRQFNASSSTSQSLKDLQLQLNSLSGNSTQRINAIAGLNEQFKQLTAGAESGRKSLRLFENGIIGAIGNMAKFQIALTAMYAPINALGSMIRTVLDVDAQMTQLRRVMEDSNDFGQILQNNIKIANELGRSIKEVNENSIGFARMGFSAEDTEDLTKVATLFQNISDLTPTEATDTLTAAMTVFNIEAGKSIDIADKLNEVKCRPPYMVTCTEKLDYNGEPLTA